MFELTDKKAIVTGGVTGLGKGMAEGLLAAGAEVALIDISSRVAETADEIAQGSGRVFGIQGDLGNVAELQSVFGKTVERFSGKLDILVNCAGIQRRNKCEEFSDSDWEDVLRINLTSVFQLCKLAGKIMLKNGKGKIINMASMLSFFGGFTVPAYAASKGGVAQLTKALSNEWAGRGVNVNAIAPGYMATNLNSSLINDEARNRQILERIPAGRWGVPDDLKGIVVFLASEASDYINGAIIPVDGGYLVK